MKKLTLVLLAWVMMGLANAGVSNDELQKAADAINKKAPLMVDQETQLTGATGANNTLTYNYKMVNYTAAQLDKAKFTSVIKPQLIKVVCPKIKPMLDAGVTAVYSYKDKVGDLIASVSLDKSTCS